MPPVQGVVLDLDGTLFDHPGSARDGLRQWLSALGIDLTPQLSAVWSRSEDRFHVMWREGRISHVEQRRSRLREFLPLLGLPVGDDAALDEAFADGYLKHYRAAWRAYDDVEAAVSSLEASGLPVAVLTNGTVEQQNLKVEALGLRGRVGPVVTAEELGLAKPHPEAYLHVCGLLGLAPGAVLHVGDDHALDVVGARGAGLQAVHLDRLGSRLDDARIGSLTELPALLGAGPSCPQGFSGSA